MGIGCRRGTTMSSTILLDANKLVDERAEVAAAFVRTDSLLVLHGVHQFGKMERLELKRTLRLPQHRIDEILDQLVKSRLLVQVGNQYSLSEAAQMRLDYGT